MADETIMCPFCRVEHPAIRLKSIAVLQCPASPPGQMTLVDTKYVHVERGDG